MRAPSPWAWPGVLAVASWTLWRDYGVLRGAPIERATVALFRVTALVIGGAALVWAWRQATRTKDEGPERAFATSGPSGPRSPACLGPRSTPAKGASHLPRPPPRAQALCAWLRTLTPAERVGLLLALSTAGDVVGPWWAGDPVGDWRYAGPINVATWTAVCGVLAWELWRGRNVRRM